jgi:hypothetical protein
MTKANAAGVAIALGLAMALLAPLEAAAKSAGAGFGARSFPSLRPGFSPVLHRPFAHHHFHSVRHGFLHRPFSHRPFAHRHGKFGQYSWVGGGGVVAVPYFVPVPTGDGPRMTVTSDQSYARTCGDTITKVPSETGGFREIRVTRC